MSVSDVPAAQFADSLRRHGLSIRLPPFDVRIRTRFAGVSRTLQSMYGDFELSNSGFSDFHVEVRAPQGMRRWFRSQAEFLFDGARPFLPLPAAQAYPALEWGLNWCIASYASDFLILHAAVVESGGCALIMPGEPGSGKSTLTAGLLQRGWRLLSDELTLIRREDGTIQPLSRPISLKNESIELIRSVGPSSTFSPAVSDTAKGTVCHLRPPSESVQRVNETALPKWIVFPAYSSDSPVAALRPRSRARSFIAAADCSFNYSLLGVEGFELLGDVVDGCAAYELAYSDLSCALDALCNLPETP